jgi:hypothetical protein
VEREETSVTRLQQSNQPAIAKQRLRNRVSATTNTHATMEELTTWHSGLLYKLSELQFATSLIKLIASFLTDRKIKVLVEGEFPTSRKIAAGVPQVSVLGPILHSLYINEGHAVAQLVEALCYKPKGRGFGSR